MTGAPPEADPAAAHALIAESGAILIDVREDDEWAGVGGATDLWGEVAAERGREGDVAPGLVAEEGGRLVQLGGHVQDVQLLFHHDCHKKPVPEKEHSRIGGWQRPRQSDATSRRA